MKYEIKVVLVYENSLLSKYYFSKDYKIRVLLKQSYYYCALV